jgi:hypothetical protein
MMARFVALSFLSALFFGLSSPPASAQPAGVWWEAPPRQEGVYALLCRGPLAFATRKRRGESIDFDDVWPWVSPQRSTSNPDDTEVAIRFRKNPDAAGAQGAGLSPGSCAWVDRPLNEAEPSVLAFTVTETRWAVIAPVYDAMTACAAAPGCVFAINAGGAEGYNALFAFGMARLYHPQRR